MYGWMGTVLRVNLTEKTIRKEELDSKVAYEFIGGRGLNSHTLFTEVKSGIDPLGEENLICIAPGPLTATGLSSSSRVEVSTISPYSNILGDGNAGGNYATYMKRAGYDQIIIEGKADKPFYLFIDNEAVELRDASDLMGSNTWETTDILKEKLGSDISVACIGQAGENLVRFASIMFDKYNSAARGSGAVMGSKNLKAVVVKGNQKVAIANPEEFQKLNKEDKDFLLHDEFQRNVVAKYGSHIGMTRWFPGYRNYEKYLEADEVPEELTPEGLKKYEIKRTACYGCVVPCKDVFKIPSGKYEGEIGKAMEHECTFCLGTNCGITDSVAVMTMENLADKYGMCVLALGNTVAMIKDLYNHGIIDEADTGGLKLEWENVEAQLELVHQIALRQGFGNVVAEGLYGAAKVIGKGAMDYCYHVKGLSRGPHPAGLFSLAHATSTRGADHLRGRSWAYGENDPGIWPGLIEKGYIPVDDEIATLKLSEQATTLTDMIGRCKGAVNNWASAVPLVATYPLFDGLARLLTALTGMEYSEESLAKASDRVYLLEMALNIRQGVRRADDRLPVKADLLGTDYEKEELQKHNQMLDNYYKLRGCQLETAIPLPEVCASLGLDFVSKELEGLSPVSTWDGPPLWPLDKYPQGEKRA